MCSGDKKKEGKKCLVHVREQVGVALDEMNCRMNVPEPIPTTTKSAMSIYINYAQRASITPS